MDFVARPLEVVERCCLELQQQAQAQQAGKEESGAAGQGCPMRLHAHVAEAFRALLRQHGPAALAAVPLLDAATWPQARATGALPRNTLVRFRGMVQDMLDPQFFVGVQRQAGTGKLRCALYSDGFVVNGPEEEGKEKEGAACWEAYWTMERRPLVLTSIPGEAAWVTEGLLVAQQQQAAEGRGLAVGGVGASSSSAGASVSSSNKRGLGEGQGMEVDGEEGEQDEGGRGSKAPRVGEADASSSMALVEAAEAGKPPAAPADLRCLSYLFGEEEGGENGAGPVQAPRLNEAVDVLAVLAYTPAGVPAPTPSDMVGEEEEEDAAMERLLLGLEPRLHILLWAPASPFVPSPASFHDPTPFLSSNTPLPQQQDDKSHPHVRAALLAHLTAALDGDALAAEYLLLALLARVRLRTPGGDVVGHLPLNLSRAPVGLAERVASLLGALVPRSKLLTVDLPTLDDPAAFIPRKDPSGAAGGGGGVLQTTPLQVAPGTVLVLDETGLDSGRLGPEGVANLRCLKGLVERQQLPCHFGFYQLDFPTDCPLLVLSRSRSILGGGALCQLPFTPTNTDPPTTTPASQLDANTLEAFRRYLAKAAAMAVEIDAGVAQRAEREFVELRATEEGKKVYTPEALGRWLTLCRLLCASEGGVVVGEGHWERMRGLEGERMGRLKALGLDPPAQ